MNPSEVAAEWATAEAAADCKVEVAEWATAEATADCRVEAAGVFFSAVHLRNIKISYRNSPRESQSMQLLNIH